MAAAILLLMVSIVLVLGIYKVYMQYKEEQIALKNAEIKKVETTSLFEQEEKIAEVQVIAPIIVEETKAFEPLTQALEHKEPVKQKRKYTRRAKTKKTKQTSK